MDQDRQNSQRRDAQNTEREQDFTTYRTAQSSNDMVPTVFRRGIYRTIRGSLKRFLSIVVITALGVSVMCGLKAGCEDLCDSVDAYFDQQNVYDINVQSTYGLTRDDLAAIQEVDGVETVEGIYTETAYTAVGTTRERVVVQSLSKENIDQPVLVSGDLPESADEVVQPKCQGSVCRGRLHHYGRGPRSYRRELRLDSQRLSRCFGCGL